MAMEMETVNSTLHLDFRNKFTPWLDVTPIVFSLIGNKGNDNGNFNAIGNFGNVNGNGNGNGEH